MPVEIVMPKLGLTMSEGLIIEWKKKEGDQVKKGEILFVLQTEKVTFEVESPADGVLGKILVGVNETVAVSTVVAYILEPGEDVSHLGEVGAPPLAGPIQTEEAGAPDAGRGPVSVERAKGREGGRVKASPLAQKIARAHNMDIRSIRGTGPAGRIVREDVERAIEEQKGKARPVVEPTEEAASQRLVAFTGMRRAIAKNMMASKLETAQTYMSNAVDASKIVELRKDLLPYIEERLGVRITITDVIMKIAGAAIREHPIMNSRWTDNGILFLQEVHMGMAMALPDGLIVPVIRDINKKSLGQIALDRVELMRKGKEKQFLPDDISGSTFTVSSMGMYGVEHFTANINVPESAILGIGAIIDKPVAIDKQIVVRPIMNVTLSYDHRIIDGAEAGKFMRTLKTLMENPIVMFAKSAENGV